MIDIQDLRRKIQDRMDDAGDAEVGDGLEEQYIAGQIDAYQTILNLIDKS